MRLQTPAGCTARAPLPQPGCPTHGQATLIVIRALQSQLWHPSHSQGVPTMARAPQPQPGHPSHGQGIPAKFRRSPPCRWELSAEQLWLQEQLLTSLQPAASRRLSQIRLWSWSRDGGSAQGDVLPHAATSCSGRAALEPWHHVLHPSPPQPGGCKGAPKIQDSQLSSSYKLFLH